MRIKALLAVRAATHLIQRMLEANLPVAAAAELRIR
jgi:hypothetical protein